MVPFLLFIAFFLATVAASGAILKRNPLISLMSVVLLFNAAILVLAALDRVRDVQDGQLLAVFLMIAAAVLVAFGLRMIAKTFRGNRKADLDDFNSLSG